MALLNVSICTKHLVVLIAILIAATVLNYVIAQGGSQSHPYSEVTLPGGGAVWTGLNADKLDGSDASAFAGKQAFVVITSSSQTCSTACSTGGYSGCAFSWKYDDINFFVAWINTCSAAGPNWPNRCACWS